MKRIDNATMRLVLRLCAHRPNLLLTAVAAAAALAAGCGDGSASGGGNSGLNTSALSTVSSDAAAAGAADNLIIRSHDSGVTLAGPFTATDGYLSQSAKTLQSGGGQPASATFSLPVARSGHYEVFVWWPRAAPARSAAEALLTHADGQTSQRLDQTASGDQWNSLGTFRFDAAKAASLRFGTLDGAPLLVDAVRLQYRGPDAPELSARSTELPVGETNKEYFGRVEASGGTAPYTFRLDAAQLPPGLTFDAASGTLSGLPALPGQHALEVEVADAAGQRKTAALQLSIVESSAAVPEAPQALESEGPSVAKDGPAAGVPPNLSGLLAVVAAMPEGEWRQVSLNSFSSAWAPPELRPMFGWGNPAPDRILIAWSSVAWDPNRGQLILYGGGHANYRGNDVYLWKGTTRRWERGSLPSEMVQDSFGYWRPVDGTGNAPPSAHTYDNSLFLPLLDRFLTFGGSADPNGGHYMTTDPGASAARKTGPYLFDPSRADANKVGGTTGSHVKRVAPHPEIVGGQMWQNRENWRNVPEPGYPWHPLSNGCSAYAQEGGKDVVYVRYGVSNLFRYTINDLNDTTRDTWELVGVYWGGPGAKATCGMDPVGKTFVRTAVNSVPFVYWDLSTPGPGNRDVLLTPADPGGQFSAYLASGTRDIADCGLDFDPKRRQYALWCGDGRVWMLKPPATPSPNGWVITQQRTPLNVVPNGDVGTGILGKWKYIDNLDVFLGVQDIVQGNVWVYKPVGWQNPAGPAANVPPTVALLEPLSGSTVAAGAPITLSASAGDSDGSVVRVEFFNGATKIGEAAVPPYQTTWTTAPVGTLSLSAVATDDRGAQTRSAGIAVTVAAPPPSPPPGGTTVLLQRGQNGYTQASDTYLSSYHTTLAFGAYTMAQDYLSSYSVLTRFAIFESEGGPVPNGARIESATLSLYKYTAYNMRYDLHPLLRDWQEQSATWTSSKAGASWAANGASGAGSDYAVTPDATGQTDFNPGWLDFDVTAGVQRMSNSTPTANYGWKLRGVSGNANNKRFYTSEYTGDIALRPKLEVRYR